MVGCLFSSTLYSALHVSQAILSLYYFMQFVNTWGALQMCVIRGFSTNVLHPVSRADRGMNWSRPVQRQRALQK